MLSYWFLSTEALYDDEAANWCLLSSLDLLFPHISLLCHTRSSWCCHLACQWISASPNPTQSHPQLICWYTTNAKPTSTNQRQPAAISSWKFLLSLYFWIIESNACRWLSTFTFTIKNLLQCCFKVAFAGEISWSPPSSAVYRPSTFLHCVQTVGFSPLCTDRQLSSAVYRPSTFLHCV